MAETSGKQILEIAERIDNELQKTRISGKYERLNTPLTLLEQMKSALEDSLSQERYAHYKETIDVLIAAISEARKGAPDAGQTLGLCIEVMSALLNDMQSDHALLDIVRKKRKSYSCHIRLPCGTAWKASGRLHTMTRSIAIRMWCLYHMLIGIQTIQLATGIMRSTFSRTMYRSSIIVT